MKPIHQVLVLVAAIAITAVTVRSCHPTTSDDPTAELLAARGMTVEQIERGRPLFIDQSCVITPRPKMAEVSAVFEYDYRSVGSQQGLSPMEATFTPTSQLGGAIEITDDDSAPTTRAPLHVGTPYRLRIAWVDNTLSDRPVLTVEDITDISIPTSAITVGDGLLSKFTWLELPGPLAWMYVRGKLPHVASWPIDLTHQWLFVKTGDHWVKLYMTRI